MTFWERLKNLLPSHRRVREQDMQEELESLRGMTEPNELGNLTLVAEDARKLSTWWWLEQLGQDLHYATRSLIHNKAFATLAVLSLALGIGANTAIYSFMESILLRSLPVSEPDSLVVMKWRAPEGFTSASSQGMSWSTEGSHVDAAGYVGTQFPYPALRLFQDNNDVLSAAFCYFKISFSIAIRGEAESVSGQYVSGNYFLGMGVPPAAGRLFVEDDEAVGAPSVAVLSYRFSQRRFGDAAQSVGETIHINNKPFAVVGVAPAEFFGAEPGEVPDVYIPMHADMVFQPPQTAARYTQIYYESPNFYWIEIMGRLKAGVSRAQAQAALEPQFRRFIDETTTEEQRSNLPILTVETGAAGLDSLRRLYAQPMYVLMTMVGLILLISCANIANLLLARAVARRREIAVRLSMGAGRFRIIRQLLTESVLLSCIGGMLGVFCASWGIRTLTLLLANGRENFTLHATLNWHVLTVSLLLSVLTGLAFGLVPAIRATRVDVMPVLKATRTGTDLKNRRLSLSGVLVTAQIALSLFLLAGAGLFLRSLSQLHSIQLGFARENILLFRINAREAGYEAPSYNRLYEDVRGRLGQVAGIRSVTFSTQAFPSGGGTMAPLEIDGVELPPVPAGGRSRYSAVIFSVGPSFFDTMQMPRVAGRDFTDRDTADAPPVVVINEQLARMFGLENPLGHRLRTAMSATSFEIVGVVREALAFDLKEAYRPVVYFAYLQGRPAGSIMYAMRTEDTPLNHAPAVRQIVRQIDSRVAISGLKTQAAHIDEEISSEITLARLGTVFAALALTIACVGLYGTVAFNVAQRTGEIGIRMAIGAPGGTIVWMILRQVCLLSLCGLIIGLPLALAATRLVRSFLYGIEPNDPLTLTVAVTVLLGSALLAGYVPARRASRIDPMAALRQD